MSGRGTPSQRGGRGRGRSSSSSSSTPSRPSSSLSPSSFAGVLQFGSFPSPGVPQFGSIPSQTAAASATHVAGQVERLIVRSPPHGATPPPPSPSQIAPPPASSKALTLPPRPDFGSFGRQIGIVANHFLLQLADKEFCQYDVQINPASTNRVVNRALIHEISATHSKLLDRKLPAYDGVQRLYTAGPLPFNSKEFPVKYADDSGGKEKEYKVTIKFTAKADIHHLKEYLQGRLLDVPRETIQCLEIVLRQSSTSKYVPVGKSFFSSHLGVTSIGGGVECWKGFYQSLRATQMGLSLNLNMSCTTFYEPSDIVEFTASYLMLGDVRMATQTALTEVQRTKLKKALKGVKVTVSHLQRKYTINGISSNSLNKLTFTCEDGQETSVVKYFHEKYGIRLRYTSWPALQCGSSTRLSYLPMELCMIAEGQRYSKRIDENQTSVLLKDSAIHPAEKLRLIMMASNENNYSEDIYAKEFGIKVNKVMTKVNARVLATPTLKYGNTGQLKTIIPKNGAWNMIDVKMYQGARVDTWTSVNFSSKTTPGMASEFCRSLIDVCCRKGMTFSQAPVLPIESGRADDIEHVLTTLATHCANKLKGRPLQLLIVILPDFTGYYGEIKKICETQLGIVSQCVRPAKALKRTPQYLENVALKVNVKTGGRNNALQDAVARKIPLLTDKPTIIFGADVTHPRPGETTGPSIAAVVASMDWPEATIYRGLLSKQAHRVEIIQELYTVKTADDKKTTVAGGMIRELLMAFYKSTNRKPERIIFYRDGVSEGMFNQVLTTEVEAIQKACRSIQTDYSPPITFVIVQKRHQTRLFATDRSHRDKTGNVMAGTVVDTQICHPTQHDFFLCSHAGLLGLSRPVHYHVLHDENKFSADGIQMLTNNLCYTYVRCTRAISVVPPAHYAHLAAFRARYYIDADESDPHTETTTSSQKQQINNKPFPTVHQYVKSFMFYC